MKRGGGICAAEKEGAVLVCCEIHLTDRTGNNQCINSLSILNCDKMQLQTAARSARVSGLINSFPQEVTKELSRKSCLQFLQILSQESMKYNTLARLPCFC